MTDLTTSMQNIRLAAAMEGDHMAAGLVGALVVCTAKMSEADLIASILSARKQMGIPANTQNSAPPCPQAGGGSCSAASRTGSVRVRPRVMTKIKIEA